RRCGARPRRRAARARPGRGRAQWDRLGSAGSPSASPLGGRFSVGTAAQEGAYSSHWPLSSVGSGGLRGAASGTILWHWIPSERLSSMQQRNIGPSGLRVSVVGLGCNNFAARLVSEATRRVVHAALDHGITLFDTADVYGRPVRHGGSEEYLGA